MIIESEQTTPSDALARRPASIGGADLLVSTSSFGRPGLPSLGGAGPASSPRHRHADRVRLDEPRASHDARFFMLSPAVSCRYEVVNYPRVVQAQTKNKNPALQGRVLVAQTSGPCGAYIRTEPLSVPTCHVATGRG